MGKRGHGMGDFPHDLQLGGSKASIWWLLPALWTVATAGLSNEENETQRVTLLGMALSQSLLVWDLSFLFCRLRMKFPRIILGMQCQASS